MAADDLQEINQKLDRIVNTIVSHASACELLASRLEAISLSVYGNGRDGLTTRVDRLETTRRMAGQLTAALVGLLTGATGTALAWLLGR